MLSHAAVVVVVAADGATRRWHCVHSVGILTVAVGVDYSMQQKPPLLSFLA